MNKARVLELGPVTRERKAVAALRGLVKASFPPRAASTADVSDEEKAAFDEAFDSACATLAELGVTEL